MKHRIVMQQDIEHQYPVTLWQTGRYTFRVVYGKDIRSSLDYDAAAKQFGFCCMHALTCSGILDADSE